MKIAAAAIWCAGMAWGMVEVDCAYPGGNAIVDAVDEAAGVVRVRPDLRDTAGDWFWFDFRVKGAQGKKLKFDFGKDKWRIGPLGPAVSEDGGETWRFLSPEGHPPRDRFEYAFGPDAKEVRFAHALPYLEKDWRKFVARTKLSERKDVELGTLCRSRKGTRDVELLALKPRRAGAEWLFAFTARHHCCEVSANPAMEGMIEFALGDSAEAKWLRENAEILFVPFMDKDGCEEGDQGKNRRPHDHNRDYVKEIYPEVRAFKRLMEAKAKGKRTVFVDLHAPWLRPSARSPEHGHVFTMGPSAGGVHTERWNRFRELLMKGQDGSGGGLKYDGAHDIPWGVGYNTAKTFAGSGGLMNSTRWGLSLPGVHNSFCIEIGYALCGGTFSFEKGRGLGANIMKALAAEAMGK